MRDADVIRLLPKGEQPESDSLVPMQVPLEALARHIVALEARVAELEDQARRLA